MDVHLSRRARERLNTRVRELTPRNWGQSVSACLAGMNGYLRGWSAHFRLCTKRGADEFRTVDSHIRRRMRAILVCHKRKNKARNLFRHLRKRGVGWGLAYRAAYSGKGTWWQSKAFGVSKAYPNEWFATRLVSLSAEWLRLNPPQPASPQTLLFEP